MAKHNSAKYVLFQNCRLYMFCFVLFCLNLSRPTACLRTMETYQNLMNAYHLPDTLMIPRNMHCHCRQKKNTKGCSSSVYQDTLTHQRKLTETLQGILTFQEKYSIQDICWSLWRLRGQISFHFKSHYTHFYDIVSLQSWFSVLALVKSNYAKSNVELDIRIATCFRYLKKLYSAQKTNTSY